MNRKSIALIFVGLLLCSYGLYAIPVEILDINRLTRASDLILVGNVRLVHVGAPITIDTDSGPVSADSMVAEIDVDQVLKGSASTSGFRFRFDKPREPIGYGSIVENTYRLVFLKRNNEGFTVTSPYYPTLPAVPGPAVQGSTDEERVSGAVARVISSDAAPSLKLEAIHSLANITTPIVLSSLNAGLRDMDIEVRFSAAAILVSSGDVNALKAVEGVLVQPPATINPRLIHNLRVAVAARQDPAAVPSLTRLLGVDDVATRRAASAALRQIGSPTTRAGLATALEDTDFEVRLNGAQGLATLSGRKDLIPSWDAFRADEQRFTVPLKEWLQANPSNR